MSKRAQIIGAGIGGLMAAHTLRAHGWTAEIFERAEAFGEVGAGLQLSPNATRILRRYGLLEKIQSAAFAPEAATMRDMKTGQVLMYAPLKKFCDRVYGAPYLHIYRPTLQAILRDGLNLHLGQEAEPDLNADLCVAAEGVRSASATELNPEHPPRFTGQVAWRGVVKADQALRAAIPPHACVWVGEGQHLVTYYLDDQRLNFVAVTEQETWQEPGWNQPGEMRDFRERFEGAHPAIKAMLGRVETVRRWALFDRAPLPTWVRGNTALLGDAAHPMLPFLAQGAAQAIEDAEALARYSDDLKTYERIRRKRTSALQAWARSNANLYHKTRTLDRLKLLISRGVFRGPQAHILLWQIFSA